jgi:hypothetical protein
LKLKKVYLTRKNSLKNKLSKLLLKAKKIELKTKNDFLSKLVLVLIECLIIKKYYIAAINDVTAIGLCSC